MFVIKHRRRREKKTDSKNRLAYVKSEKPRLVIRKSLENLRVQIVNYNPNGDQTSVSAISTELKKYGWKSSRGNLPAAYLTGFLAGIKAKKKHIGEAILDLGLQTSTKGSRLYAALKGVLDSGVNVPHSKEILPEEKRLKGLHISEQIAKNFEETKKMIEHA